MSTPTVSHSEVESFLLCERKHFYGYSLELERVGRSDTLYRGVLGHEVNAAYFEALKDGKTHLQAMDEAQDYLMDKQDADNAKICGEIWSTMKIFKDINPFRGYRILAVEKEFVLETKSFGYPFKVDLIASDPRGRIVVVDNKWVWDFYRYEEINILPQVPKYMGALRALDYKVDYGAYAFFRWRPIKDPQPSAKFRLEPFDPPDVRIVSSFREQMDVANEINRRKALPLEEQSRLARRVANKMVCGKCSLLNLCGAELNDKGADLIMRTEYTKRDRVQFARSEAE